MRAQLYPHVTLQCSFLNTTARNIVCFAQQHFPLTWITLFIIIIVISWTSHGHFTCWLAPTASSLLLRGSVQHFRNVRNTLWSASEFPQRHIWTPPRFHTPPVPYSSPPFDVIEITCFGRVFTNTRLDHVSRSHFDMREARAVGVSRHFCPAAAVVEHLHRAKVHTDTLNRVRF